MKQKWLIVFMLVTLLFVTACGGTSTENSDDAPMDGENQLAEGEGVILEGTIEIDGSSTVYPVTEAVAEEFSLDFPDVRIPVGVSGTGGGFKRFCAGEIAISNASRTIKDSEVEACKAAGIEYVELEVTYDGLSVLVNPQNDWVDSLTVAELNAIFKPASTVKTWKDVRAEWPEEEIKIYSPGSDSGTFDYFTETINGEAGASRNDTQVTFSEDDNSLVSGISGDKYAIGYFGFAYFEENQDKLKLVPIDNGNGPVAPSEVTINDGTYAPLSRPLFIYVNVNEYKRPEVQEFVRFYIIFAGDLSSEVGYIAMPAEKYDEQLDKLDNL
jgi:phosphate transport system substrate-binding protein